MAVACGIAILAAGSVLLLRLADEGGSAAALHAIGETVEVGDVDVEVLSFVESEGAATVELRLGGAEDPDVADGFRLWTVKENLTPTGDGSDDCRAATIEPATCTLSFDTSASTGSVRVLRLVRGDNRASWQLLSA